MPCPKCGTNNGLYRYASAAQNSSIADGLSCLMCGYWFEGSTADTGAGRAPRSAGKRKPR
jgi:hypothetical protein